MDVSGDSESVSGASTARNNSINLNDPCSPFFLHPSDDRNDIITPVLLIGSDNYDKWCESISTSLRARNKLGFVDGTIPLVPPKPSSEELKTAWNNVILMVSSWIINTLDEPIKQECSYLKHPRILWDRLKYMYAIKNVPKTYELWSRLNSTKQEGMCVKSYYTMLSDVWNDLHDFTPLEICPCPQGAPVAAWLNRLKVCQFLMGLDDAVFGTIRSRILNMKPEPTIDRVYDMILQQEDFLGAVARGASYSIAQDDTARLRDIESKSRTKRSPSVLPLPPSKLQALDSSGGSSPPYDGLVSQTQNLSLNSSIPSISMQEKSEDEGLG